MEPARWRQLESLYSQAIEMNETQRAVFLREACGDDEALRHDLEGLFAVEPQAASFLEKAALREIAVEFAATAPPSWVGRRIGNYEFVSLAGAGGMGEVYRARDTKLKRDVAIKILRSEFALDADWVSRFRREAQLLASLNHPSIAAVYDLEEADGHLFLILELVDGETLADRIRRGPVAVEEALKIALQIAEALESAHEKSVIHRDLKPANIKVTAEGKVKVLDFGLAKALLGDAGGNLSNSPTMSMAATQQGVILGTAAYMSPEQARGQSVDRRADIWAFGCVLFEMLSGRGTFGGKTVSDVIASVLKTPPDWSRLPANLHPRILHLLERCLDKEPQDRSQGLADARVEIKNVLADPNGVLARPPTGAPPKLRTRLAWIAAVAIAVVIASILTWTFKRTEPVQRLRFTLYPPEGQDFFPKRTSFLAISRDGKLIAHLSDAGISLVDADDVTKTRLVPGSKGALGNPVFSPDNQWLTYIGPSLMKIPVGGGKAIPLIEGPLIQTVGASWTKNDTILFASTTGILEVPATGGTPKVIIKAAEGETLGSPELLPDGKSLLFSATTAAVGVDHWESAKIFVQPLKSGERKLIWTGGGDPHYVPTGHIVYAQGNSLFALPFEIDTFKMGPPVLVAEGLVRSSNGVTDTGNYDISDTGTLVYVQKPATIYPDGVLALVDLNGGAPQKLKNVPPGQYRSARLSPDGNQLAAETIDKDGKSSIWTYDMSKNSEMHRLAPAGHNYTRPIWKDNETVSYGSDSDGTWRIYSQRADGGALPVALTAGESGNNQQLPESWSHDGRILSFVKTITGGQEDWSIWTYSMDTRTSTIFHDTPRGVNDFGSTFSPDGASVTYTVAQTGIFSEPFPKTGFVKQLTGSGANPVWSRQNELIFRQERQGRVVWMAATVDFATKGSFEIRDLHPLPFQDVQSFQGYRTWDIAPKGDHIVVIVPATDSPTPLSARAKINIIVNWFEELRAPAPPR